MKKVLSVLLVLMMLMGTLLISPLSVSAADGWNGTTATKPSGDGTKESPYLISSAENLLWMSQNIKHGENRTTYVDGCDPTFTGTYFIQTCDIDLNGKALPSIGYYVDTAELEKGTLRFAAFSGNYDGCGFSIKNGSIKSYNTGHGIDTFNWGHGLFGMIYGATIRNIVMDNVTVQGHGITGFIVGRAVAATSTEANPNFNIIENCVVKDTCKLDLAFPDAIKDQTPSTIFGFGNKVGGIAGMVYCTTIRNCTNAATMTIPGCYNNIGGIAGSAGFGSVVEYCVFSGRLEVSNAYVHASTNATYNTKDEAAAGGIVGFIGPFGAGAASSGGLKVLNCYNSGTFQYTGATTASGNAFYWGGIIGVINILKKVTATTDNPYPYMMENCYNLFAETTATSLKGFTTPFRIGGLLGSGWCSKNADGDTLWIKNSSSVKVDARHYTGTNEYRHQTNKTKYDYYPVEPVKENDVSTVTTQTEAEIKLLTARIDAAVERALTLGKSTYILGVQKAIGDNTKVRIVAGINTLDALNYGFEASVQIGEDATKTAAPQTSATVYTSLLADGKTITSADYDVNYFACVTLTGIPASGTVKYTVRSFITKLEGVKIYGDAIELTFVDGVLSDAPVIVQ